MHHPPAEPKTETTTDRAPAPGEHSHDVPKVQPDSIFNSFLMDAAGVVLSIGSSVAAAVITINKNFFKNAEKEKRFEAIHQKRDALRAAPEVRDLKGSDWLKRIRQIEAQHDAEVMVELKEMGIHGPLEKFRSLRAHQKTDVFLTVAAVTAGAIGIIGGIIGSRHAAKEDRELNKKLTLLCDQQGIPR